MHPDLRAAGVAILVGAVLCFVGAGTGASYGFWFAEGEAYWQLLADHPAAWRVANWPWVPGILLFSAGVAVVSGWLRGSVARVMGHLWLAAGVLGALVFAAREVDLAAARAWADTGVVPSSLELVSAWVRALSVSWHAASYGATFVLGLTMVRQADVPKGVAWAAIVWPLVVHVVMPIPAGVVLAAVPFAVLAFVVREPLFHDAAPRGKGPGRRDTTS